VAGVSASRSVPGGSFLLRFIRDASSIAGVSTTARVRGTDGLVAVTDFADERVLEVVHEIRGENPEYRVMQSLLSEGATFVDVGANFGTFSLLASRMVGQSGRVIAIEPQAKLASLIEESIALSEVRNCEVNVAACGAEEGSKSLIIPDDDSGRAGFFGEFSARSRHTSHTVKVTTLDSILEGVSGTCVIKIDVEGSEIDVLDGGERAIRRLRPAILIELNPWSAAAAGRSPKQVIDRLVALGYSSFASADTYPRALGIGEIAFNRQANIVATA
jgi:FkbM family methyltransferase